MISVSSRKGFVDRGRSGAHPGDVGEMARFRKGLLDPRLIVSREESLRS